MTLSCKGATAEGRLKLEPLTPVSGFNEPAKKSGDTMGFPKTSSVKPENKKPVELKNKDISDSHSNGLSFCSKAGYTSNLISNGTQQRFSTCSITVFGSIPSFDNMVSTIILEPTNGELITKGNNITVKIQSIGIEYGFFDDPTVSYYVSPQTLNSAGEIQGHNHITIQKLNEFDSPPDPRTPVFFKGLNEVSTNGVLQTEVDGSVFNISGIYRICTMTATRSHAPVLMPVARRGTVDDCIRVLVA